MELLAEASTFIIGREPRKISKIGSAMGMEHAEEEGSSKHKTLVYRKIPDISPARSEGMGSAVQIVDYTKVEIETHFKGPIELTSKDGVNGSMNVSMVYSLVLDVTVRCKDHAPVQREFILNCRRGNKDCITEMLQCEMHLLSDGSDDSHRAGKNSNLFCCHRVF